MSVERLHLAPGAMAYDSMLAAEHVARYAMAAGSCRGRRVLDVACGEGYGSAMLAAAGAAAVVGVDISAEAVALARARFGREGLEFRSGDAAELPKLLFDQAPFDLIVSFETIEHLADARPFLEGLRRLLAPGGAILISAPNDEAAGAEADNPFHRCAYTLEGFCAATEAVLGPADGIWLGMPLQGFGIVPAGSPLCGADREGLEVMLEGETPGLSHLLPAQRAHRVDAARASFFLAAWGVRPAATIAAAPISFEAFVETWRALEWLRAENARLLREAAAAGAAPEPHSAAMRIAGYQRAAMLDAERLEAARTGLDAARATAAGLAAEREALCVTFAGHEAQFAARLAEQAAEFAAQQAEAAAEGAKREAELSGQLAELTGHRTRLEAELHAHIADLDAIRASRSWRVIRRYARLYESPLLGPPLSAARRAAAHLRRAARSASAYAGAVAKILTPGYIAKGLRFVFRGDPALALRAARYLVQQRMSLTRENEAEAEAVEVYNVPAAEPGVPLVSIVIPCVNDGAFVGDAVASALSQTFRAIEVIVVDGGSDDGTTPAVVAALAGTRVRVLLREGPRKPVGDNRNFGIAAARGRYICCLDADDILAPTYIEKALFVLEQGGFDVVGTSLVEFEAGSREWRVPPVPTLEGFALHNEAVVCSLFRKDAWARVGGYSDVTLRRERIPEDWDFWLRLAAQGARFRNIAGETLLRYRIRRDAWSLSRAPGLPTHEEQLHAITERHSGLLTEEAMALSRRQAERRLRPANSHTAMAEALEQDTAERRAAGGKGALTVIIAISYFHVGGAERLLSQVAAGLAREGWRVIVIATGLDDPDSGDSLPWFEAATPECYALNRFLPCKEWRRFVRQLLQTRRPDVLLNAGSHALYDLLPEIAAKFPRTARLDLLFNLVGHVQDHFASRDLLTGALCENGEVLDWLIQTAGWRRNQVAMVTNGVDSTRFTPGPRPAALIERLGIAPSDIVIGWAGRMAEEKSPETFVELAHRCRDIPGLRFVMAGDGPLGRRVAAAAGQDGPALLGLIEDMPEFYRLCDVFVLTSRLDGRPNAVLEAQAAGCAILASRVGGVPEMVADERVGLLAEPGDPEAFEAALRRIVASPEGLRRMRAAAAEAAGGFSMQATVEGYRDALAAAAAQVRG